MAEFRRTPRAITQAGQIKGAGGRHEKDDRFRIDDRSTYVLGWTNERKIDALLRQAAALQAKLSALTDAEGKLKDELDAAIKRGQVLAGLDQTQRVRRDRLAVDGQQDRGAEGRARQAQGGVRRAGPAGCRA